ncbi:MAG: hypothetical protein ACE37H_08075 [Phycisphaeraceae bacterium]
MAASITTRLIQAFDSYRWLPLPELTQAAAWTRLLDFAGHLQGESDKPVSQAATTYALQQWLHRLGRNADDAIGMLLDQNAVPDKLLEMLLKAAIEETLTHCDASIMQQAYQLLPATERLDQVRRLRAAFPVVNRQLMNLPSWSLIEELPTLHGMCVAELEGIQVQHDSD